MVPGFGPLRHRRSSEGYEAMRAASYPTCAMANFVHQVVTLIEREREKEGFILSTYT